MTEDEIISQFLNNMTGEILPHMRQIPEVNVWEFLIGMLVRDSLDRGTEPRTIANRLNQVAVSLIESGAVVIEIDPED